MNTLYKKEYITSFKNYWPCYNSFSQTFYQVSIGFVKKFSINFLDREEWLIEINCLKFDQSIIRNQII